MAEDMDFLVVAFGTSARVAKTAIREARRQGIRVGLLRPITLFPFPVQPLAALASSVKTVLVVEMNAGQMVDDVRLGVAGRVHVEFLGHTGGVVPMPEEILARLKQLHQSAVAAAHVTSPDAWLEFATN
jgi:2-oxoglutarate ferredoxin oxidoreductase subunit alpha